MSVARATSDSAEEHRLLNAVVSINVPVAHAIAHRYSNRGAPVEDLEQTACEGLVKAVYRFDLDESDDLLRYAVPMIRGEVLRYFRDHGWLVRPPRSIQEGRGRLRVAVDELSQDLGRSPTRDEIAARLEISVPLVAETEEAGGCYHGQSLDRPRDADGGATPLDVLEAPRPEWSQAETNLMLAPALRDLAARDQQIVYLRYVEDLTQRAIGVRLSLSQMQVSRILTRVHSELRHALDPGVRT